jgi:glyoxylase-like metal-dependent hydrolase (beta-lactamase superfamily II)
MKLEVLGCHGGELPGCRSTCFLVDGVLALDAGALTASLDLAALVRVDHIVLTHSHFDHVKDLPLLGPGGRPADPGLVCQPRLRPDLRENLFNGAVARLPASWPRASGLPARASPRQLPVGPTR